jgi:poly [ADP-ribose] polymerase
LKKVILKGNVPVDQYFSQQATYKVLVHMGTTYAKTLNQSNIQNNNNKFYILQILQSESNPNQINFFTRWGRVGVEGQRAEIPCVSPDIAIHYFNKKCREKINGGYREVEMNYDADAKKEDDKPEDNGKGEKKEDQPEVQSNLDKSVQDLVRLIFDMKMMNNQMKEIGYDAKKMPLGKLAKSSILRGYEALKGLMDEVKGKGRADVINKLSSDFYSEIPHDFGFQRMQNFTLNTEQKVKQKLEMLQSLEDIQIFTKLLDEGKISSDMNELDSNYLKLGTSITPLDKNSETFKLLLDYVENTHASTHTAYKLQVEEIYEISKDLENSRYRKDIGNKQLLWHGSRLTNFVGILSQGLRIAPP